MVSGQEKMAGVNGASGSLVDDVSFSRSLRTRRLYHRQFITTQEQFSSALHDVPVYLLYLFVDMNE